MNKKSVVGLTGLLDQQIAVLKPERLYLTRVQINGLILFNFVKARGKPMYRGIIIEETKNA
ncbi:unnamed protein product [marine sediment metagenome]|uniref:Uncharacterized protein n=1 Tax=marine sediment metagenome TaxID=412755 RepID=X0TPP9_9ZZZZ